ncbi:hypothetical protein B484DRAFT_27586, partial [Ochromonadaceae sp. CCMP2298]
MRADYDRPEERQKFLLYRYDSIGVSISERTYRNENRRTVKKSRVLCPMCFIESIAGYDVGRWFLLCQLLTLCEKPVEHWFVLDRKAMTVHLWRDRRLMNSFYSDTTTIMSAELYESYDLAYYTYLDRTGYMYSSKDRMRRDSQNPAQREANLAVGETDATFAQWTRTVGSLQQNAAFASIASRNASHGDEAPNSGRRSTRVEQNDVTQKQSAEKTLMAKQVENLTSENLRLHKSAEKRASTKNTNSLAAAAAAATATATATAAAAAVAAAAVVAAQQKGVDDMAAAAKVAADALKTALAQQQKASKVEHNKQRKEYEAKLKSMEEKVGKELEEDESSEGEKSVEVVLQEKDKGKEKRGRGGKETAGGKDK